MSRVLYNQHLDHILLLGSGQKGLEGPKIGVIYSLKLAFMGLFCPKW